MVKAVCGWVAGSVVAGVLIAPLGVLPVVLLVGWLSS